MNKLLINMKKKNFNTKIVNKLDRKFLGNLYFFKRYSNIFVILLDYNRKHIATLTGGNCKLGKNKKNKISPFNMLNIVVSLKELLLKHNIKLLNIYLKQRFSRHLFSLKKMFKLNEVKINKYIFLLYKSYGLTRKRSIRRI